MGNRARRKARKWQFEQASACADSPDKYNFVDYEKEKEKERKQADSKAGAESTDEAEPEVGATDVEFLTNMDVDHPYESTLP